MVAAGFWRRCHHASQCYFQVLIAGARPSSPSRLPEQRVGDVLAPVVSRAARLASLSAAITVKKV